MAVSSDLCTARKLDLAGNYPNWLLLSFIIAALRRAETLNTCKHYWHLQGLLSYLNKENCSDF